MLMSHDPVGQQSYAHEDCSCGLFVCVWCVGVWVFEEMLKGNAMRRQQDGESPTGKSSSESVSERTSEKLREVPVVSPYSVPVYLSEVSD